MVCKRNEEWYFEVLKIDRKLSIIDKIPGNYPVRKNADLS